MVLKRLKRNKFGVKLLKDKSTGYPGAEGTESTEDSSYQQLHHHLEPPLKTHKDAVLMATTVTTTGGGTSSSKRPAVIEEDQNPQRGGFGGLHYFWGSFTALQIYAILVAAILVGRVWILHGITLILLRAILETIFAWHMYFARNTELQQALRACQWLFHFGKSTAEGALEGKSLSTWLVGTGLQFWRRTGKGFLMAWWRDQRINTNHRIAQDLRRSILQGELSRQSYARRDACNLLYWQ